MKRFVELQIKIINLGDEARTIRGKEKGLPGVSSERERLHNHRVVDVRRAARHSLLAYGLLRRRTYASMEKSCYEAPDKDAVGKMARKFGAAYGIDAISEDDVHAWFKGKPIAFPVAKAAE